MADKPYYEMTDDELADALRTWEGHVETAGGWSSAYFAARQCEGIERVAISRGLPLRTKHHVKAG